MTSTSDVVLPAWSSRRELTIVNDAPNATDVVYLQLSTDGSEPTAVAGEGIRLNGAGGSWTTTGYTGAVAAITAATANLTIVEI